MKTIIIFGYRNVNIKRIKKKVLKNNKMIFIFLWNYLNKCTSKSNQYNEKTGNFIEIIQKLFLVFDKKNMIIEIFIVFYQMLKATFDWLNIVKNLWAIINFDV